MLKILRDRGVKHKIFIGLAIAVISTFVLSGVILNREDAKTSGSLGTVNGHKVGVVDYLNSYRAVQHQLQFMFGERWNEMRRYINLKGEAWDRILLYEEARRQGFHASDKEVVDWIAGQEAFQRQGKYYPELYRMAVRDALRMEPRDFEEEMRRTLTVQKLSAKIVSGVQVSDEELKSLFKAERALRDIEYIVQPGKLPDPAPAIDDKEIESVYGIVKDRLTHPAQVKIRYVFVPKDQSEAQKELLADNSTSFEDQAKKYGLEVKTTGYFSQNESVPEIGLSSEILSAAFTLPVGGESSWMALPTGSYRIKVDDSKPEQPMTLDESRNQVKKLLLDQKAADAAVKTLTDLKPTAEKDGLAAVAQSAGLQVESAEGVKPENYLPGIGPASQILQAIGSLKENEFSAPLAVPGGAALIHVKKDRSPDDAEFEKNKEEFRKEITSRKSQDAIKDLLEKLRKNLILNTERMKEIFPEDEETSRA